MSKITGKLLMGRDSGLVEARGELVHVHLILLPPSIPSFSSSHVSRLGLEFFLNLGVFAVIVNSQQGGHISTLCTLSRLGSCGSLVLALLVSCLSLVLLVLGSCFSLVLVVLGSCLSLWSVPCRSPVFFCCPLEGQASLCSGEFSTAKAGCHSF